jgi:tetratricopeptide (TPR) repeat protein
MDELAQSKGIDGVGAVSSHLSQVAQRLLSDPVAAARGASEVLDAVPGQQQALMLLVAALRILKQDSAAEELLDWMAGERPGLASVQYELGMLLSRRGSRQGAIERLLRVAELEANHAGALRLLGDQLAIEGDLAGAGRAYARHIKLSLRELQLTREMTTLGNDELVKAENLLRESLAINPTDVMMRGHLARVFIRLSRFREARAQLVHVLELAPDFRAARDDYALVLNYSMRYQEAIEQLDILIGCDSSRQTQYQLRKADSLVMLGEYDRAFELLESMQHERTNPRFWLHYGVALRTAGGKRSHEAVSAYRKCLELDPGFGAAWAALANLKTYRFSTAEIEKMEGQAARDNLDDDQRVSLELALGEALESQERYADSFEHYQRGNTLHRPSIVYDAAQMTKSLKQIRSSFTPEFVATRINVGCPTPDPIFIVGMARAGSTLIEQILSNHSCIEGTFELPDLTDVLDELRIRRSAPQYLLLPADLDRNAWTALGERYLELTRRHRKTDKPFFTDKAGANFMHLGFIHLMLPNAKIIDARRHPLGCCFSCYKQFFTAGSQHHSYDLTDVARYYRDYVEYMAHFDKLLHGRVHRVLYEDMVRDPEGEVRRLLAYCGLPFEDRCLRFYESARAVRTISSEQVRRPINASAAEKWKHFEPWLGPAKEALGDVLTLYPKVPEFID